MHATSTVDTASDPVTNGPRRIPPSANSRSFARAFEDIREGFSQRELWSHLGWQDIKQRYRRSVIGPFWITISQGVISLGLGLLYSQLWGLHTSTFLPYISTGFIVWTFISGCLSEGMETFISNEGLIKQIRAPLTVYALRTVWRQTLMFAHNLIVVVIIDAIFFGSLSHSYGLTTGTCGPDSPICHPGLGLYSLSAIPAFFLLAFNAWWITLLLGIISTRYRDIPQVINSLIQLLFYMTPIVWPIDQLYGHGARSALASWVVPIVHLNPFYHFVQILRAPLIGQAVNPWSWVVVGGITVVGWLLALVAMRNYRARVSYWV
ncbi:ABC transporter permease [Amycolatopsis acidiphila]|uniref:ABC transporter permease n=1 Tax=Amycolatopsis acidiphila TaxID=715473 RepID=A0A558AMQ9_9PSEU|nr:ABC transporter permease [Amycolatopsis acidiphila]TVT25556.1 ABC transporter permease [Amycolatopsis acidiphila]UIJ60304.1 ABC transporter permease [Amycolatopsis acidiphila]GHG60198.1 sugar ABC transporter permease [Amycolatopsis acidiphila]